jgi:hypothetical protein
MHKLIKSSSQPAFRAMAAIAIVCFGCSFLNGCSSLGGNGSTSPTPPSQYYDQGKQAQEKASADHLNAIQARNLAIAMAHLPKGFRMGEPPVGYKSPQVSK